METAVRRLALFVLLFGAACGAPAALSPDGGSPVTCANSHPCDANASCADGTSGPRCTCNAGFEGDGKTCTDVDECQTGAARCDANATCTNTPGSYSCACNAGFAGDGTFCADIDECQAGTAGCAANATCTNTPGSFTCTCPSGFAGDGKTCTDIDECATGAAACDANATCTNTTGSYTCACDPGYSGDGRSCAAIDSCLTDNGGCGLHATCTDTGPGTNTCACDPGWSGDGKSCADVNECATNNGGCGANSTCLNLPGSWTCPCDSGFVKDGTSQSAACVCGLAAPVPGSGQDVTYQSFTAGWSSVAAAVSYRLDVASDAAFILLLPGFSDLDVGSSLTAAVPGLAAGTTYYFRVRSVGLCTSASSAPSPVTTSAAPAWPEDRAYGRTITVTNAGATTLSDYPVRVALDSSNFTFAHGRPDGADLLPTSEDFSTPLAYQLESFDATAQTAVVWVRVPSIPAGGSAVVQLLYGNPSASSTSSYLGRYEAYDDFTGTILDPAQWEVINDGGSGSVTVSGGNLVVSGGVNHDSYGVRTVRGFRAGGATISATLFNWSRSGNTFNYSAPDWRLYNASGYVDYANSGDTYWPSGFQHCSAALGTSQASGAIENGGARGSATSTAVTFNLGAATCLMNGATTNTFTTDLPDDASDFKAQLSDANPYDGTTTLTIDKIVVERTTSPEPSAAVGSETLR